MYLSTIPTNQKLTHSDTISAGSGNVLYFDLYCLLTFGRATITSA